MPKIKTIQRIIDRKGSNIVKAIVEDEMGCDFQAIPLEYDYGFDCYITFFENVTIGKKIESHYIPIIMRAQLKSGDSYFKKETEDSFLFYLNKKDIDVWYNSNTPVILILYKPKDKIAYWINIRRYIEENGYTGQGSLKVNINKKNKFSKDSYNELLKILFEEQRGLPFHQIKIYRPIYNFLLGKYNTIELDKLKEYQDNFENSNKSIITKDVLNNKEIKTRIEYSLSQRRLNSTSSALSILEELERKLIFKKNNIKNNIISKLYFYQCILFLEECKYFNAKSKFEKFIKINKIFKKNKKREYSLINALINDALGNLKSCLRNYNILINDNKFRNNILKGILCILAGVACRKHDIYYKSKSYFLKSLNLLKSDHYLQAVAKSNLGALYFIMDKSSYSLKYYDEAKKIFERLGYNSAVSTTYRNISDVSYFTKSKSNISYGESYDLLRSSVQAKSITDHELIKEYQSNIQSNYSEEYYELYSKNNKDLSYLYNDGYYNYTKAQNLADHLGDLRGRKNTQYQNAKYTYLIGCLRKDFNILQKSLCEFILLNDKKGIEHIADFGFKTEDKSTFLKILQWTYEFKGDRNAELGRLAFYTEFADYIPKEKLNDTLDIIINSEKKNYNFYSNFDYGRNSIEALKKFTKRISKTQTKQILKLILNNIKNDNWIIRESNIELLKEINYDQLNISELKRIIKVTSEILLKSQDKYDIYFVWQHIMKNEELSKTIFDKILKLYNSNKGYYESVALSNPDFSNFRNNNLTKTLIENFGCIIKEESQRENLHSYSGGGFDNTIILVSLSKKTKPALKDIIFNYITEYIKCENLIPAKRTKAIQSLSLFSYRYPKQKLKLLQKILLSIINNDFKNLENRYEKDDVFYRGSHDYKKLKAVALSYLVKSGYKNSKFIIKQFSELLKDNQNTNTLVSVIKSLGEIGIIMKKDVNTSNKIKNYLFQFIYHDDSYIAYFSIKYLSLLIKNKDRQYLEMFSLRLRQLITHNNLLMRYSSAEALSNLKSNNIKINYLDELLTTLRNDISFWVCSKVRNTS